MGSMDLTYMIGYCYAETKTQNKQTKIEEEEEISKLGCSTLMYVGLAISNLLGL